MMIKSSFKIILILESTKRWGGDNEQAGNTDNILHCQSQAPNKRGV